MMFRTGRHTRSYPLCKKWNEKDVERNSREIGGAGEVCGASHSIKRSTSVCPVHVDVSL